MRHRILATLLAITWLSALPASAKETARAIYTRAQAQERTVRDASTQPTLVQFRRAVALYESLVRQHPTSSYCDNALWQAANLASLAFDRFGQDADRKTSVRLLNLLIKEYPSSKLSAQAKAALPPAAVLPAVASLPPPPPAPADVTTLKEVQRTALADGIRLTVTLDAEIAYHQEEITNPRRLFFDLKNVKTVPGLQDTALKFKDDVVKEVRLGRRPQNTTRLVVDLDGISGYTVYPLYSPYRLVVDFRRVGAAPATPMPAPPIGPPPSLPVASSLPALSDKTAALKPTPPLPMPIDEPKVLPSKPAPASLPPAAPAANANGKFSLSRQLGLTVSRIVIDAGHGGHDPGAQGNGVNEAELTLDVALRLQKLLEKQPGVEVVMTRDTDVFIPLEERTAIANREGADMFLSIHANASRNALAHGVETYFLNFAMNPEAEAVAARENASSGKPMHSLPDIVKAIALNNKINESRDLAGTVQKSMVRRLGTRNKALRDLGVKQAPFVVLIGASMPSVLAEISFVTNRQEGTLLKTQAYRQQIAQALFDAVLNYQQSLKRMNAAVGKKATTNQ